MNRITPSSSGYSPPVLSASLTVMPMSSFLMCAPIHMSALLSAVLKSSSVTPIVLIAYLRSRPCLPSSVGMLQN
eukprot:2957544-Rhodomonas_salina.1